MSKEIMEIVRDMDLKDIEYQIALQCAPLLAGLKLSNLLMIQNADYEKVRALLKNTKIAYFVVADTEKKMAILLFDRHQLTEYVCRREVWQIFQNMGYRQEHLGKTLYRFRTRYEAHLQGKQDFPHEMGLLLGYPVEDVKGFIRDQGEHCLYTGYWKVYQNLSEKKHLFCQFEQARDAVIQMLSEGFGITDIIQQQMLVCQTG